LAQRLGCAGQVCFLGQQKRIEELYAAADVFCLPTFADPCAIASVEAMVCGLPSVTSRFNGAAEWMQHGRDGFIVEDPANAGELAAVLEPLFDAGRREEVGRAAAAAAARFAATEGEDPVATAVEEMARICRSERGMA
ncbi:MAG TPA: glycosyltransferase, partial [Methylomirabilota bacterium]|nr:glycosyltransferase [Methylomirabilota bacterium]